MICDKQTDGQRQLWEKQCMPRVGGGVCVLWGGGGGGGGEDIIPVPCL